jgi:hypothetical protein
MLSRSRRHARRRTALLATAIALVSGLALSGSAYAGQDLLAGGTVDLQLKGSKKLKWKPGSLNLTIIRGKVDPITGEGTVDVNGKLRAKSGKRKARVSIVKLNFGANGAPGEIVARVGEDDVTGFGILRGGTTTRQGFGANLTGISATLGNGGAKEINRQFKGKKKKKKKGGASAAARKKKGGRVKPGLSLGSVSATTVPKTIEVLPGGTMTLHTSLGLVPKLLAHCIEALTGGVGATPPATFDPLSATFTFPVTGGTLAPDFTDGSVKTTGGQTITKNFGLIVPFDCTGAPPVGTQILQTGLSMEFGSNALGGTATLPDGVSLQATIGDINFGTATRSFNPATGTATITGATVTVNFLAAATLNNVFPNASGDPNNNFSTSDVLGTLDLTATVR